MISLSFVVWCVCEPQFKWKYLFEKKKKKKLKKVQSNLSMISTLMPFYFFFALHLESGEGNPA